MTTTPKPVILTGNTDTRGLVEGEERERLAKGFGHGLQYIRKQQNLTLEQLGQLAGVGKEHLSRLERGQRRPSVDLIKAVCRVLMPENQREQLETILAKQAGESLREGNQRKKRRETNSARKRAQRDFALQVRKIRRLVSDYESRGKKPPEALVKLANSEIANRTLKAIPEPGPGIKGVPTPGQRLTPREMARLSQKELLEYLEQ